MGPTHPNGVWSRCVMGVDDTLAYAASVMIRAWYLVSVNLKTGEDKVQSESPTERVMDIVERSPGAWAIVQMPGAPREEYWLHGQAIQKTGDAPPRQPKPSP